MKGNEKNKSTSDRKLSPSKNVLQAHLAGKSFLPALEDLYIYGVAAGIRHHHVINSSSISGRGSGAFVDQLLEEKRLENGTRRGFWVTFLGRFGSLFSYFVLFFIAVVINKSVEGVS